MNDYRGCDIIDINPGIGLWSSKVHEWLKPRRHVLVEPAAETYKEFLQPLITKPESRYRLAGWKHQHNVLDPTQYLTEDLLPEKERFRTMNEQAGITRNSSLLILANLGYNSRFPKSKRNDVGSWVLSPFLKISDYLEGVEGRYGFHCNGGVRMLLWMLDREKSHILPRSVAHRRALAVRGERACHIEEIVGCPIGVDVQKREIDIDVESSKLVKERQLEEGNEVSFSRLDGLVEQVNGGSSETLKDEPKSVGSLLATKQEWRVELQELERGFTELRYSQFVGGPPGIQPGARKVRRGQVYTPEYNRLQALSRTKKSQDKKMTNIEDLLMIKVGIDSEDLAISQETGSDANLRHRRLEALDGRMNNYRVKFQTLSRELLRKLYSMADDRRAWGRDSPLLMWDQRTAEPITPSDKEFYNAPMALLDFQPKDSLPSLTKSQKSYRDAMMTTFFASPQFSIVRAIDTLAPGAAKAVIPLAPTLRDPQRGGQRDLDQLRVRMLTPEMINEVAVAFDQWAFKPTVPELSRRLLSATRGVETAA